MREELITANTILYCRRWDETVRFYRDGLGLPVLFATGWFVELALTDTARVSLADEAHASVKSCGGGGITLALQVRDIEAAREELEQRGLRPTEVKQHPWNAKVFYLFDPEERRIEFWQSVISDGDPEPQGGGVPEPLTVSLLLA